MNEATRTPGSGAGCINPAMLFTTASWIAVVSYGKVGIEYVATSSFMALPNYTWGALAIGQLILLGLPLLLLFWLWKEAAYRAIYRSWLLALGFLLLNLPAYFLPQDAANGRALYMAASALLLSTVLRYTILRANNAGADQGVSHIPWITLSAALFFAGLFAIPWMVWGAAGSLLEMFLQLLAALSLGMLAALLYAVVLQPHGPDPASAGGTAGSFSYLRTGFAASVSIMLLASSTPFSFGAMQLMLMVSLPALGWVIPGSGKNLVQGAQAGAFSIYLPGLSAAALLVGLGAAAPMMWFDPDELALIISAAPGEAITWAAYASFVSLASILTAALLLRVWSGVRSDNLAGTPALFRWLLPGAAWVILAVLFVSRIQAGLYGDELFVILEEQADLRAAAAIPDPRERRAAVYQQMVHHTQTTQSVLRARLDRWGIDYQPFYLVNAIQVQGGPLIRLWLEGQPEVDRVLDNPWMRPLPQPLPISMGDAPAPGEIPWNLRLIQADRVWEEFGARGQGILIGNSDSGIQLTHPELQDSYRGAAGSHDYNWFDPWYHTRQPTDIGGHGTHTLGIVMGNNTGVAPDAQWIGCTNLARNLGNPALYLDCLQFMLAPFPMDGNPLQDGRPDLGANVLNNSWGCPEIEGCDLASLAPAVEALRVAGIFVVASAGNDGPWCGSLDVPPAVYESVFSVGAVDSNGSLAIFSSIGADPAGSTGRAKPDLVAPGMLVISSFPNGTYAIQSGTSMAGPHVAGVVALLWSANPELIGDIDRTEEILTSTAQPYQGPLPQCPGAAAFPSTAVGYGLVDAYQAVRLALQER